MADSKISQETAKSAFDSFDTDKSGSLDAAEFFELAGKLGLLLDKAESEAALAEIDESKDGKIQFEEFYAWLSKAEPGKKKGSKAAKLRAALLTRQAVRFVENILGGEPVEGASTIKINLGDEAKANKSSISASVRDGHVIDIAQLNCNLEGIILSLDVAGASDSATQFFTEMLKNLGKANAEFDGIFHVTKPNENTTRLTMVLPGTERDFRKLAGMLGMLKAKLGESAAKIDLGFNFEDLAAEGFGFNKESVNVQVSYNGIVPAEVAGILNSGQVPPPVMECPGVKELAAGEKKVEANLTDFVFEMFNQIWPGSPLVTELGMEAPTLRSFIEKVIALQLKECAACSPQKQIRKQKERGSIGAALKMALATAAFQIKEVQAFHVRDKAGTGFSIELKGFPFEAAYKAVSTLVDLALSFEPNLEQAV